MSVVSGSGSPQRRSPSRRTDTHGCNPRRHRGVGAPADTPQGALAPQLRGPGRPSGHERLHAAPLLRRRGGPPGLQHGQAVRRTLRCLSRGTRGTAPPLDPGSRRTTAPTPNRSPSSTRGGEEADPSRHQEHRRRTGSIGKPQRPAERGTGPDPLARGAPRSRTHPTTLHPTTNHPTTNHHTTNHPATLSPPPPPPIHRTRGHARSRLRRPHRIRRRTDRRWRRTDGLGSRRTETLGVDHPQRQRPPTTRCHTVPRCR